MKFLMLSLMFLSPAAFAGNTRCMPNILQQVIASFDEANARGIVAHDQNGSLNLKPNLKVTAVEIRDLNKNAYAVRFELYVAPIEAVETSVVDVDYAICTLRHPEDLKDLYFSIIGERQ